MDYTCVDYRTEMILLGLKRRLQEESLSEEEKEDIRLQIKELESTMGLTASGTPYFLGPKDKFPSAALSMASCNRQPAVFPSRCARR